MALPTTIITANREGSIARFVGRRASSDLARHRFRTLPEAAQIEVSAEARSPCRRLKSTYVLLVSLRLPL
jgi:hypothetical protein